MTKPPSAQVRRSALWTGAVMCALLLSTGSTRADDDNGIKELVKSMSDYLAAQKSISFDMQSTLDVVTTDGQRLGIASSGAVELNRPDKIRAERKGGFADVEVVFDGKTLTILGKNLNAYTQIPLAGGIDELVAELRDKHGRPLPAADLLMGLGAAAAGGVAGVVVGAVGYGALSYGSLALAMLVVLAAGLARTARQPLAQ